MNKALQVFSRLSIALALLGASTALGQARLCPASTSSARRFGKSFAIVHDPTNERIWGLGENNEVFVLKINKATADIVPLN